MSFVWSQNSATISDFELLKRYVLDGWTLKQFSDLLGCSTKTIQKRIHQILLTKPPVMELPKAAVLVIDATRNRRIWCWLLYRDTEGKILIHRFERNETFESYTADLRQLKAQGYEPRAMVSDGHPALLKAMKAVYPAIPHQRCLIHIKRQALVWLTRRPKSLAGQTLKYIALELTRVTNQKEAQSWNLLLHQFEKIFNADLTEKSYAEHPIGGQKRRWWYTHKSLRRTWRLMKNALPNLWFWLENPAIPRTTNLLEGGINSPVQRFVQRHTGLTIERQKSALEWWVYFRNLR